MLQPLPEILSPYEAALEVLLAPLTQSCQLWLALVTRDSSVKLEMLETEPKSFWL